MPSQLQDIPHELTRRQVRSGLLQGFWAILEAKTDRATVAEVIAESGLPEEVARDASGWLSYAYYDRLNHLVAKRLYDLDELPGLDHPLWQMWRETPGHAMEDMGVILAMFRSFSSTEGMYRAIAGMSSMGNVGIEVEHLGLGPGLARYAMRAPDDPAAAGLATVWKVYGWLERMQTVFGLPPARVKLEVSEEEGRPVFLYRVEYQHGSNERRLVAGYAALGAGAGLLIAPAAGASLPVGALLGASVVLAVMGWRRLLRRAAEAQRDGERLRELIEQLDDRYVSERRALLTTQKLSGYLAAELVDEILENPDAEVMLGGQDTAAAVLFSDIVAFTPRCEQRTPGEIVAELNTYFSYVDPVFARHGGVIDKRIGDGIMVVFATRGTRDDQQVCEAGVRAAVECLDAVVRCNEELEQAGAPPIAIRVGLAYGPLIQGHMGSEERLEYTVIGDTVNLAARLESAATSGHVLVDAPTWDAANRREAVDARVVRRESLSIKGKSRAIEVVELAPPSTGARG